MRGESWAGTQSGEEEDLIMGSLDPDKRLGGQAAVNDAGGRRSRQRSERADGAEEDVVQHGHDEVACPPTAETVERTYQPRDTRTNEPYPGD